MPLCLSTQVLSWGTKFQVIQGGMGFLLKIPGNWSVFQVRSEFLFSEFL